MRHAAPHREACITVMEKMILASNGYNIMSQEQPHLAELGRPELQKRSKQETNMKHKITEKTTTCGDRDNMICTIV